MLAALVPSLPLSFSERAARVVVRAHSGLLVWEPQGLIVAIGALSIIGALFLKMRPWGACRRAGRGGGRQVKPRRRLFLCPYRLFQSPYRLIGRSHSRIHGLLRKQRRFPRILAGNYHYAGRSNPQFATNRQAQGGPPAAAAYASTYVSIRQGIRQHTSASRGPLIGFVFPFLFATWSACCRDTLHVSIRQRMRQHTSACTHHLERILLLLARDTLRFCSVAKSPRACCYFYSYFYFFYFFVLTTWNAYSCCCSIAARCCAPA